ncbi:MAG: quinate 5-dehydrogenase [Candidatus Eremiobacterota bacterium]
MKKIVSVSLGSSKRDHHVNGRFLDMDFDISRIGTDGDFKKALTVLKELDGHVDAIGLGGIDIYLYSKTKRYALRDGLRLKEAVKITPVVDGSSLKNSLERETVTYLVRENIINIKGKPVLMVCAMDRFGMASSLVECGANVTFGDMMFTLDVDKPIYSLQELEIQADRILPEVCKLPISMIYPVGKKQDSEPVEKYRKYYEEASIIAGDYHFIRKYMPSSLSGKIIITNTITPADIEELRKRHVSKLITTTPDIEGRSFGTNVLEAILLVLSEKPQENITDEDYLHLIKELHILPRVEEFVY